MSNDAGGSPRRVRRRPAIPAGYPPPGYQASAARLPGLSAAGADTRRPATTPGYAPGDTARTGLRPPGGYPPPVMAGRATRTGYPPHGYVARIWSAGRSSRA